MTPTRREHGRTARATWFVREGAPVRGALDIGIEEGERTLGEHLACLEADDREEAARCDL